MAGAQSGDKESTAEKMRRERSVNRKEKRAQRRAIERKESMERRKGKPQIINIYIILFIPRRMEAHSF